MDIKELEFIRDFCDELTLLQKDITDLAIALDEETASEETCTLQRVVTNNIWSLAHQAQLIEKNLENFKSIIDRKYWSEWKKKHPHVHENYDIHHQNSVF